MVGRETLSGAVVGARVAGFINHLRRNDFHVGPAETQDGLQVLRLLGAGDRDAARLALKILLAGRPEEWRRFDDLFEAYWFTRGRERMARRPASGGGGAAAKPAIWSNHLAEPARGKSPHAEAAAAGERGSGGTRGRLIASKTQALARTDLRHIADPEDMAQAEELAYRLARAMRYRLSRRHRIAAHGTRLDLRRTIRRSIPHGGEPIELVRKARPDRPVRIIVLLDVSGSMQLYARVFLQFIKGLVCSWMDTDAYLFHTRLMRVTDAVRERDSIKAMTRLAMLAEGFGGGTKLGECLKVFNERYARRALNSRSVVIILSDGYDTGPPDLLGRELKRLKRRAPRLVWLNPLLGWRDYAPVTGAMRAAMPYIDHFAAAHTLEALAALEADLANL